MFATSLPGGHRSDDRHCEAALVIRYDSRVVAAHRPGAVECRARLFSV
jgi:hypothetical protein